MKMLWTDEQRDAENARIKALTLSTGKPHLFLWTTPMGPDYSDPEPAEWMYAGPTGAHYTAICEWMDRMDERRQPPARCPDGVLPDGPVCPRCGGRRGPSGVGGGTWVHY